MAVNGAKPIVGRNSIEGTLGIFTPFSERYDERNCLLRHTKCLCKILDRENMVKNTRIVTLTLETLGVVVSIGAAL